MLEQPAFALSAQAEGLFQRMWAERNQALRPGGVPLWAFLDWLTRRGYLLHGSPQAGLTELRPRRTHYGQPDEFSNTPGIYAASDGLWAMMYALGGRGRQQSDMALRLRGPDGSWTPVRYFYSLSRQDPGEREGRALLRTGTVYVLAHSGFTASPPYEHGGLGWVQELHWVHPGPVIPLWAVPVSPEDFPLPVRIHDAEQVSERSRADPWGFPWLEEGTGRQ